MGDSKHTPGPWRVTDMHPEEGCRSIRGPQFEYVAEVAVVTTMHGDNSDEVREANARLVAAAPAMLEALESIAMCNECSGDTIDCNCPVCVAQHALAAARGEEVGRG